MNLGSNVFCHNEERGLGSDTTVAFFAIVAAGRVEKQSCAGGVMRALSLNHSEELLGMVPFEQSTVRAEIRDYLEGLGV